MAEERVKLHILRFIKDIAKKNPTIVSLTIIVPIVVFFCFIAMGFIFESPYLLIIGSAFAISAVIAFCYFYFEDRKPRISDFFLYLMLFIQPALCTYQGVFICKSCYQTGSSETSMIQAIFLIILQICIIIASTRIIVKIIRANNSDGILCLAAISEIYMVIVAFATIYSILYFVSNNAILHINNASALTIFIDMLYFSTVTFTTLGYGDIVPNNGATKTFVILEVFFFVVALSFVVINLVRRRKE